MKLLFDENLSPHLVGELASHWPDSKHIEHLGMRGASDEAIWAHARDGDFVIVSKDDDLHRRWCIRTQSKPSELFCRSRAGRLRTRQHDEDFRQAGDLYRSMNEDQKSQFINNWVAPLQTVSRVIQLRQFMHFYKADADYGSRVATGLGIAIDELTRKAA